MGPDVKIMGKALKSMCSTGLHDKLTACFKPVVAAAILMLPHLVEVAKILQPRTKGSYFAFSL